MTIVVDVVICVSDTPTHTHTHKDWKAEKKITDVSFEITQKKTKIEKKNRSKSATSKIFTDALVEESVALEKVVRTKTIDIEPMELDEAILQMELLGHDFFIIDDWLTATTNCAGDHFDIPNNSVNRRSRW